MQENTIQLPHLALFRRLNAHLQQHPEQGVQLRYADEDAFECSTCAQCCRFPWAVYIDRAYYDRQSQPLAEMMQRPVEELFKLTPPGQPAHAPYAILQKQPDSDRCIFLDEDNLCRIHKTLGPEAKPSTCNEYPRLTLQKSRVYRSSSMMQSCFTVARQEPQDWPIQYGFYPLAPQTPHPLFRLTARAAMDRHAFLLWIGSALDVLMNARNMTDTFALLFELARRWSSQRLPVLTLEQAEAYTGQPFPAVKALELEKYRQLLQGLREQLLPQSQLKPFLHWLEDFAAGEDMSVRWTPEEQALLLRYQKQYFQRAFLMQAYVEEGFANVLQQLYLWSSFALLQQLLTRFYVEQDASSHLKLEHLAQATNVMHALLVQNPRNIEHWGISRWPDEICFVKIHELVRALKGTQAPDPNK